MEKKKKIPCRVCGKLFTPCAYCQSHADVFRWRNFACSEECAKKYISDTTVYRDSLNKKKDINENKTEEASVKDTTKTRKKKTKITSNIIENESNN